MPPPDQLWRREVGEIVTDHRSSWVRRVRTAAGTVFVKTYEYKTWGDRLRDFGRRTAPWSTPRPHREFDALVWLLGHGFAAPSPLAALCWRQCGFVARTTLVTAAFDGEPASELLPRAVTAERITIANAIGSFVARLHALGFRDRNLDLRNLLVASHDGTRTIAKIDSPRFVLRRADRTDALARADWDRLLPQLAAFGVADAAAAHR